MPPVGTLYLAYPAQSQGVVARAVAKLTSTELLPTPPEYKHFQTNSSPEWQAKFPLGKVPAFEGVDGFRITEGIAIARYFANCAGRTDLLGSTPKVAALVDQWQSFAYTELGPPLQRLFMINKHYVPFPGQETYDSLVKTTERAFDALNRYIATFGPEGGKRRFVATEDAVTVADLVLAVIVGFASSWFLDGARRLKWAELEGYFEGIVGSADGLREVYGALETCDTAVLYVPKAEDATA